MKIVSRDVELMGWILEQKFMTREQVRKTFWKEESKKSIEEYRRLGELQRAGFLRRSARGVYRHVLYLVAAKGVNMLRSFGKHQGLSALFDANYAQYHHDVVVTDLRIMFREWSYVDWISERVLAKRNDLRYLPDGVILHQGSYFAVEYEATAKSKRRYREIFLDYEMESQVVKVLFIAQTPDIATKIGQQSHICQKLYCATFGDIREHGLETALVGATGTCSLREFLDVKS